MTISTSLERIRLAGKVCKFGAWIVAVMGFIAILAVYIVSSTSFGGPDNGPTLNNTLTTLAIAFLLAIPVIFFCLVLYAVGTFLAASFARMRSIGKACKLGAWIVAIMGLIAIFALYIISNPFSDGSGNGSRFNAILINLAIALLIAILILFFCFILYAIGSLLVYLGPESPEKDTRQGFRQESDEFVEIVPIPER